MAVAKSIPPAISQQNPTLSDDFNELNSMSLRSRLLGFGSCILLGCFLSALAYSSLSIGRTRSFAILYSLTNITFISGTAFIVGPVRQFQLMFTAQRIMSSLIYLAATVAVILTALRKKMVLATVLFMVQVLSLIWYTLSYVPYAQEIVTKFIGI